MKNIQKYTRTGFCLARFMVVYEVQYYTSKAHCLRICTNSAHNAYHTGEL